MRRSFAALALAALLVTAGCSAPLGTTGTDPGGDPAGDDNDGADADPGGEDPDEGSGGNDDGAGDSGDGTGDGTGDTAATREAEQPAADDRTVQVAASGTVEADPDRAVVRLAVVARSDNVSRVREQLAENSSRMRTALLAAGVNESRIVSSGYDIGQNYRYDPERNPDQPRFQGEHSFTVTLEDTSRAGPVVVTGIENGANRVEGVEFTVSESTRRELRREALGNAVANGREQARTAASEAGLELAGVDSVRTAETSVRPYRAEETVAFAAAGGDGGGGAPTRFEGGSVTVSAQALVTYNATNAG